MTSVDAVLARYQRACSLSQRIQPAAMSAAITAWFAALTTAAFSVQIAASAAMFFEDEAEDSSPMSPLMQALDDAERSPGARAARMTSAASRALAMRDQVQDWLVGDWGDKAVWETPWWCVTAIGALERDDQPTYRLWEPLLSAFETGAWLFRTAPESRVLVAPIPSVVRLDSQRRLHCEDGSAFVWLDMEEYHWHGVQVSRQVILDPASITDEQIARETDPQRRRILIERRGRDAR